MDYYTKAAADLAEPFGPVSNMLQATTNEPIHARGPRHPHQLASQVRKRIQAFPET